MAASLKISELNALDAMASDDLFLVTDTSAGTSKKVTYSTLVANVSSNASTVLGVSTSDTHLGTFTGDAGLLTDNVTVKIFILFNKILKSHSRIVDSDISNNFSFVPLN